MELLFLHLDDIKESGERLHEARVESMPTSESVARGQVAASTWASSPLVCKTKIGPQASREHCESQEQGDNTPPRSVCMVHCDE